MRDWSSDVCSSDLLGLKVSPSCRERSSKNGLKNGLKSRRFRWMSVDGARRKEGRKQSFRPFFNHPWTLVDVHGQKSWSGKRVSNSRPQPWQGCALPTELRSEEHTSELQSLMRISYAVFCLKKKKKNNT